MSDYATQDRYLRVCRETVWGECPAEPDWTALPFLTDGIRVGARREHYVPETLFGGWRRTAVLSTGLTVAGSLRTWLWPQTTGLLMGMALERDGGQPGSYCFDVYAPTGGRRCTGVVAGEFELSRTRGSDDVAALLALQGRIEEANGDLTPEDFDHSALSPVPFGFAGAAIGLGGRVLTGVEEFAVRVDNGLVAGPLRCGLVAFLAAGPRTATLELRAVHDSDALAQAVRDDEVLAFSLELQHPGGHSLTVSMPRLHPEQTARAAGARPPVCESVRLIAEADPPGTDIDWSLDLSP